SNLTDEEKAALHQQVSDEVNKAKGKIDDAKKADDVNTAQTQGETDINNIPTTSATKEAAKKAIDQAAQKKNDAIDKSNLTDEEKAALHQQVSDEVNKAKGKIDDAKKADDVNTAQTQGETDINNIPTTSATKETAKKAIDQTHVETDINNNPTTHETHTIAKKAIDQAAQKKNDAIDKSNLTDEEKAALHQQVSDEVNKAKGKIDDAKKADDVNTAQTQGE